MVWLILGLLAFQNDTFYELYDAGLAHLEAKEYRQAIEALEKAIAIRPNSSETAKTYGVRFTTYLPYNQLAKAYLALKDFEKAQHYLRLAYRNKEDEVRDQAIAGRLEMIQEVIVNYKEEITRKAVAEPPPATDNQPKITKPALAPVLELLILDDFQAAIGVLDALERRHPEDKDLDRLRELTNSYIQRKKYEERLEEDRASFRTKLRELGQEARTAEAGEDLENALRLFMTIRSLDKTNDEAVAAVRRLRQKLEERGKTDAEIEQTLSLARDSLAQLEQERKDLEQAQARLAERNRDLNERLQEYKKNIDVDWYVTPGSGMLVNIQVMIRANMVLEEATLLLNGDLVETWEVDSEGIFRSPPLINYQLPKYNNTFELRLRDVSNKTYIRTYPFNLPRPTPLINRKVRRNIFLVIVAMIGLIFGSKMIRRRKAFRERFNPYIAGAPVLNQDMFYGRLPLLKQILNTLHNNSLMIYGERRIGKTSFLHRLNDMLPRLEDPTYEFIPIFVDLQGVREEDFFANLDHEIGTVLETRGIELEPAPHPLEARKFISRLRKYINALKESGGKKPKLVLLLDEVDIMNGYSERTNQQLRSVFMKGFADHIVAVMAGIHINTQWKSEGSPWYNFFEQIELKPFTRNQAMELINDPVNGVYQYTRDAVERIMEITGGKPYLIQKMCLNLVAHILATNQRKITAADVDDVFGQISKEFYGARDNG